MVVASDRAWPRLLRAPQPSLPKAAAAPRRRRFRTIGRDAYRRDAENRAGARAATLIRQAEAAPSRRKSQRLPVDRIDLLRNSTPPAFPVSPVRRRSIQTLAGYWSEPEPFRLTAR